MCNDKIRFVETRKIFLLYVVCLLPYISIRYINFFCYIALIVVSPVLCMALIASLYKVMKTNKVMAWIIALPGIVSVVPLSSMIFLFMSAKRY